MSFPLLALLIIVCLGVIAYALHRASRSAALPGHGYADYHRSGSGSHSSTTSAGHATYVGYTAADTPADDHSRWGSTGGGGGSWDNDGPGSSSGSSPSSDSGSSSDSGTTSVD